MLANLVLNNRRKGLYCGHNETYGAYSDFISIVPSVNMVLPTALTDAATTINSDGQKVVAMYTSGGKIRYKWLYNDGGNSGETASKFMQLDLILR